MPGDPRPSFWRSTIAFALAGCCLLWVSFPPVGLSWLAWLAPLPWLYLIERPTELGRRPYWALWLVGLVFWLAMLQGIRLAHWLNHFGWLALFRLSGDIPSHFCRLVTLGSPPRQAIRDRRRPGRLDWARTCPRAPLHRLLNGFAGAFSIRAPDADSSLPILEARTLSVFS